MKQILSPVLIISLVLLAGYLLYFEPEIIGAATDTATAAVTLTVTEGIDLTGPSTNLALDQPGNMSITVDKVTNAAAGATWNVKTNSQDGWKLEFTVSTDDCLYDSSSGERFTDYTEAVATTPEVWSVSSAYEFGFNVEGTYITGGTSKWGTGTDCYEASPVIPTAKKYQGFETAAINVGTNTAETNQAGEDIIMCVAVEQETIFAPNGSYSCTVTGTATDAP